MEGIDVRWIKSKFELLAHVPVRQLNWLIKHADIHSLKDGELLFENGLPLLGTHFITGGRLHLYTVQNNERREIGLNTVGDITGYLPYSRGYIATLNCRADGPVDLLTLPLNRLRELIRDHYELTEVLVHTMNNRVRSLTGLQQQNEKMMALGKLSAGLAHELNNPASAIVRVADTLKKQLGSASADFQQSIGITMKASDASAVKKILAGAFNIDKSSFLTLLQRAQRDDEIINWLALNHINGDHELTDSLSVAGFLPEDLDAIRSHLPPEHLHTFFKWLNNHLSTTGMLSEIQESGKRIFNLVNSVKEYTQMGRAQEKQYEDIHDGICNTLTMLNFKLRAENVTVEKDFDKMLPKVNCMIGELNQVWTNIIENAIEAMNQTGERRLTICTRKDREFAEVAISNNGPGIPAKIQSMIFDPFFTTKEIGKGTGMGLDVVNRIVRNHRGSVKVISGPGQTKFTICLPVEG